MHPNNKLCKKVDDDDDDDLDSLAYIVYNSGGTTKKPKGHCRLSSSWSRLFLAILNGVMRIFPTTKQELTSFNNNNKQHQVEVEGCNVFFVAVGNVASLVTGTSLARCDAVMVKSEGDIFGGTSCVPFKLRALYRHVVSLYKAMREMISSLSLPILYLFITGNLEATCRNVRLALKRKLPHSMVPAFFGAGYGRVA